MIRLSRQQVREVDRRAIEEFGIPGIVLMENAARGVADVAQRMLCGGAKALILCGGGNNGGDALAAARHLHIRGVQVQLMLTTDPQRYRGDALVNWNITRAMKLPWRSAEAGLIRQADADLILDGIFGTGLIQPPRPPFDELVSAVEKSGRPVLAIDLPSGLDCDTGMPLGSCIRATTTVTFVAEKLGFSNPAAQQYTGKVIVVDIGCPRIW